MALVPPELVSEYYQINKPEIRIEDTIMKLLQQTEMPDDLRGKLLSQLIPKYQRSMQPKKQFEFPAELKNIMEPPEEMKQESAAVSITPMIAKYLSHAVPKSRKKYILPILESLKNANYVFNDMGELEVDGKPQHRSNAIDLFSYVMRDLRSTEIPPKGYQQFLRGIYAANIPKQWIGNKNVRDQLDLTQVDSMMQSSSDETTSIKDESSVESSPIKSEFITPTPKKVKWKQWTE